MIAWAPWRMRHGGNARMRAFHPNTLSTMEGQVAILRQTRGPWDFKPEVASMQVHPGQLATVVYEFRNRQARTMTAQAIPSYAPQQAMPRRDTPRTTSAAVRSGRRVMFWRVSRWWGRAGCH